MKISLFVDIDKNLKIRYTSAQFDSAIVEENHDAVIISVLKNDLSRLISRKMKCSIDSLDEDRRIKGDIDSIAENNGCFLVKCNIHSNQ